MASSRILVEFKMAPLQGSRFQPAGFPDLGAAVYDSGGRQNVLVDSPQAVANHLEGHCLTPDGQHYVDDLKGLPMVRVKDKKGEFMTNSVLEGHRLASPYVLGNKKKTSVGDEFDKMDTRKSPLEDRTKILGTVFKYDIGTLLHGAWFSRTGEGRIRITRAMTAFIEASDAKEAESGGVKRDHVTTSTKPSPDSSGDADEGGDASTGMGSIPFHRVEYAASEITGYFNVDVAQIRAYGLGDCETELLEALAAWKIRKFLDMPYRPRTACDLQVQQDSIKISPDSALPSLADAAAQIRKLVSECSGSIGGENGVTPVTYEG